MTSSSLKQLIIDASLNTRSSWAIVRNGAVAEFSVSAGDRPVRNFNVNENTLTVDTPKANLKLDFDESIKPIVSETAAYRCSPWSQCVYLCVPDAIAKMSNRKILTHLGVWNEYQQGELWDLGIGNDSLDFCIVVNHIELQQALKKKEGSYVIDDPEFLKEIVKLSPWRLVMTKFAHILVKQRIPVQGQDVDGPHTHLLPHIIHNGIDFPIPIDDNLRSLIQIDPFGSVIDANGEYFDWRGFENDPFQTLLNEYSDEEYIRNKKTLKDNLLYMIEKKDIQSIINKYSDKRNQDLIRVILAQIVCNKEYDTEIRKSGWSVLAKLNAINSDGVKDWIRSQSPELNDKIDSI